MSQQSKPGLKKSSLSTTKKTRQDGVGLNDMLLKRKKQAGQATQLDSSSIKYDGIPTYRQSHHGLSKSVTTPHRTMLDYSTLHFLPTQVYSKYSPLTAICKQYGIAYIK